MGRCRIFLTILGTIYCVASCSKDEDIEVVEIINYMDMPLVNYIEGEWVAYMYVDEFYNDATQTWDEYGSHEVDYSRIYGDSICTIHMENGAQACYYYIIGENIVHLFGGATIELRVERNGPNRMRLIYDFGFNRNVVEYYRP